MATEQTQERGKTSLADIAATLVGPAEPVEDEGQEDEVSTSGDIDGDDTDEVVTDEADDHEEELEASEIEGDEQEDEQSDEGDDEAEYLDIRDDDIITVMVDGEEQEVSIGDLKKAHSGEGAIEKRLQEATETRKAAIAERSQMLEKLAEQEAALTQTLSNLDDSVFSPVIPEPNAQMRRTNPEQYLRHKDAYDADQKRIADAKKAVQDQLNKLQEQRQQRLSEFAQEASQIIAQEIPELTDEKQSSQMFTKLATTAKAYGYTDAEIQSAIDPRMFMLVRDAMRYRDLMDKTKGANPTNLEGQRQKKVRRLRTGATQAKNRVRQADKKRKEVTDRARKTGKVADVAATLLKPRG